MSALRWWTLRWQRCGCGSGERFGRCCGARPQHIALVPDDWHTTHVGRTADGRGVFITTPFDPLGTGIDYVARYLFDADGGCIDATIEALGVRGADDARDAAPVIARLWAELGAVEPEPIAVRPFKVHRFGMAFGLIAQPPEDVDDCWSVNAMPGDYLAFMPPWEGDYDT